MVAAGTGNALEFYDFAVFASLTPVISTLFFPAGNPVAAILSTLALYAVGFVVRPVGAILLGQLADRRGRKFTLFLALTLMGVTTVLVGVMPTYAQVGILAPALLCLARVLQGISVGGEFGTAATYLIEHSPRHKRGLYGSFAVFSSASGSVLGIFVVLMLTISMTQETLSGWGWRLPFLLGFPLLAIGMYLRFRLAESPEFEELKAEGTRAQNPLRTLFREHWRAFLTVLGISVGYQILSATIQGFLLTHIRTVVGMPAVPALTTVLIAALLGLGMVLVVGTVADRIERRTLLLMACGLALVLPLPCMLIISLGGFGPVLIGQIVFWIPLAIFGGVVSAVFADLFPAQVRASGFGIAYGFGVAGFAGTTPFVATLLVDSSGTVLAPAWYVIAAAAVTMVVVATAMRRTT
ncbi:MFS transporter [Pseudonocardia halophobica]|uniref:MFS transporter n=1 Tax=Pseudonocardia halophobica TaxID=29401 RepID=UPI000560A683|nr:MFS transporter [Pseudonocardia halophobica]